MTMLLSVVYAIARDEDVLDAKADEIDRRLDFPPLRLVEQRAGPKAADLAPAQQIGGESDRPAGVDDVVDEQNVSAFEVAGASPRRRTSPRLTLARP